MFTIQNPLNPPNTPTHSLQSQVMKLLKCGKRKQILRELKHGPLDLSLEVLNLVCQDISYKI